MKCKSILALTFGLGLLACQQNVSTDDSEKLKSVLRDYFDAIKNKDYHKMTDVTTDDFLLYEEGKVWNNDSVFKEMNKFPYTVEFKFYNFKTTIDRVSGHMAYYEQADFLFNDTVKLNLTFVGNAAFRKTEGTWKINFMHTTKKYTPDIK